MTKEEAQNGRDDMLIDDPKPQNAQVDDGFNPNYLKVYYGKLFPHADMFNWMSYGNDGKHPACDQSYFGRREFSFTLDNDIYLRFQSFKSASELENGIKDKCPFKIDIGPVYSVDPSKRLAYAQSGDNIFTPVERELVFDIDISDYDDARYCCSGADVCLDCWPLMTIAIKVIDTALRDDFGFNHILWVYSGRRGVHCWVCDGKARRLNNEQRSAIADYFRLYKGNSNSKSKVSLLGSALHPFLVRSYVDVLKDFFEEKLLCSQQLLSDERYEKILEMIPDESITSELRGKWQDSRRPSSGKDVNVVRWEQLKHLLQSGKQKAPGIRRCVEEIVFSFTYPRIDIEVSKHMNHLLKAPFCVHPKTGRVCVPINPAICDEFDPTNVPTLSKGPQKKKLKKHPRSPPSGRICAYPPDGGIPGVLQFSLFLRFSREPDPTSLLGEINTAGLQAEGDKVWDRTSMGKSIRYFRESFLQPLLKSCKEEIEGSYSVKVQQSKNSLSW